MSRLQLKKTKNQKNPQKLGERELNSRQKRPLRVVFTDLEISWILYETVNYRSSPIGHFEKTYTL